MVPLKVAIVGGSVSGLTVALHLEQLGIDWVLIERHRTIAPQLGASFSLNPNGLSVLSQLGCFSDIDKKCQAMESAVARDRNGKILNSFEVKGSMRCIFGYDVCFTERQILVDTLYQHILAKDKIYTEEKVINIWHTDDNVEILTQSGRSFTADVVIGADGIHSPVRSAMWEVAKKETSDIFGDDPASCK
jgi:2-polyprenyl-6-methoxyphenol hydroxylase-like FAD-dependent oxidoreductase